LSEQIDSIDISDLKQKGVQVLHSFFTPEETADLAARARQILDLRDAGKLTVHDQDSQGLTDEWFAPLVRNERIIELMVKAMGPNICMKGHRVLAKDKHFKLGVHVHQDWPYNIGDTRKTSIFIMLSKMNNENGGLIFYEGSHHYGPVSQGPLDPSRFPPMPEMCPDVDCGDLIICDFLTWHYSNPSSNGGDRLMIQINYQPADDSSSAEVLAGVRSHDKVLTGRFDAASTPSVELNCAVARKHFAARELDRATRFARGLLYDDADHVGASILLSEILHYDRDPDARSHLTKAKATLEKMRRQIEALEQQFKAYDTGAESALPWRALPVAWENRVEGYANTASLPAVLATPDTPWVYGGVSKVLTDITRPSTIRIRCKGVRGQVGFCLINEDGSEVLSEQMMVSPDMGETEVKLVYTPNGATQRIVARNWDDPGRTGEVIVEAVDILTHSWADVALGV
jgi:hypothetical protein